MTKNNITISLIIIALLGIIGAQYFSSSGRPFGAISILSGPTSNTVFVNTTSSGVILSATNQVSYRAICSTATTTWSGGGEIITLLVATSSEVSTVDPAVGLYRAGGGADASYILTFEQPCIEFVNGKNLTNRTIYGVATSTQEGVDYYVTTIEQ